MRLTLTMAIDFVRRHLRFITIVIIPIICIVVICYIGYIQPQAPREQSKLPMLSSIIVDKCALQVTILSSYNDTQPSYIQTADGKYMVAFCSNRSGNYDIWLTSSSDGINWHTPIQITKNISNDYEPCLIQISNRTYIIVFSSERPIPQHKTPLNSEGASASGGYNQYYTALWLTYSLDGVSWATPAPIITSAVPIYGDCPAVVEAAPNVLLIAYTVNQLNYPNSLQHMAQIQLIKSDTCNDDSEGNNANAHCSWYIMDMTPDTIYGINPSLIKLVNNSYLIAYTKFNTTGSWGVYRYGALINNSMKWSKEFIYDLSPTGDHRAPAALQLYNRSILIVDPAGIWLSKNGTNWSSIPTDGTWTYDMPAVIQSKPDLDVQIVFNLFSKRTMSKTLWLTKAVQNLSLWSPAIQLTTDANFYHNPSLLKTDTNQFILAFNTNVSGNHDIWVTTSSDFINWSQPIQVTHEFTIDTQPVIVQTPQNEFWIEYYAGNINKTLISPDGKKWSKPHEIPARLGRLPTSTASYRAGFICVNTTGIWCSTAPGELKNWTLIAAGNYYNPSLTKLNDYMFIIAYEKHINGKSSIWVETVTFKSLPVGGDEKRATNLWLFLTFGTLALLVLIALVREVYTD